MTFPVIEQGAGGPWDTVLQFNIGFPTGLVVRPANDDAPDGWGIPLAEENGSPINDGRGTIGGSFPDVLIRRPPPPDPNAILTRAFGGATGDLHTEDWRESLFDATGDIVRWVPQFENRIGAWSDDNFFTFDCPDSHGGQEGGRILFYKNREIATPKVPNSVNLGIGGAAIFTRPADQKKFFICAGVANSRISTNGIYVIVRPVDHPKGLPDADDTFQILSDIPGGSIDNLTAGWAVIAGTLLDSAAPELGVDIRGMRTTAFMIPECQTRNHISSFRFDLTGTKFVFSYNMRNNVVTTVEEFNYHTHQVHEIDPTSLVITTIQGPGALADRTDKSVNTSKTCNDSVDNDFPDCLSIQQCGPMMIFDNITSTTTTTVDRASTSNVSQSQTIAWDWDPLGNLVSLEWSVVQTSQAALSSTSARTINGDYCHIPAGPSGCTVSLKGSILNSCDTQSSASASFQAEETWTYTIKGGLGDGLSISWLLRDQNSTSGQSSTGTCNLINVACETNSTSCSGSVQDPSSFGIASGFTSLTGEHVNILALDLRYGYMVIGAQIVEFKDFFSGGGTGNASCLQAPDCPGEGPCGKVGVPWDAPIAIFLGPNIPNPNIQTMVLSGVSCNPLFPGCEGGNCFKGLATRDVQRKIQAVGPTITTGQFDRTMRDQHNRQGISNTLASINSVFHVVPLSVSEGGICSEFDPDGTTVVSEEVPNPIAPFASNNQSTPRLYRNAWNRVSYAVDRFGDLAFQTRLGGTGRFNSYWFGGPEALRQSWDPDQFTEIKGTGGEDAQDDEFVNFYTFQDLDTITETPGGARTRYHPVKVI